MKVQYNPETGKITGLVHGDGRHSINIPSIEVDNPVNVEYQRVDTESNSLEYIGLEEVKARKIGEVKEKAKQVLSVTDWYVVRKNETGEKIPDSVISHRSEVRSLSDRYEMEIEDMDNVESIIKFDVTFPNPPDN